MFLPDGFIHLPVLAPSQLVLHGDVRPLDLPLVRQWGHAVDDGFLHLGCRVAQRRDEAVRLLAVVMHQLGDGTEFALRRDKYLVRMKRVIIHEISYNILLQSNLYIEKPTTVTIHVKKDHIFCFPLILKHVLK